jgi:two-component system CheB/CheR fusion protein
MFTQGNRSLERIRAGLGVGLNPGRSPVDLHESTFEAPGAGLSRRSKFEMPVPLARADAAREARPARSTLKSARTRRRRVLVVDDNPDLAESLARLLELLGYEARIAFDGPSAVDVATDFVPDLALVDIGLPGINGYDVARRIREIPELQHVVLVAQTGWSQEEDRRRSREAGFDHHLFKPLELGVLQELLAGLPEDE